MRIPIVLLLSVHGLLHLLGFLKSFGLAALPQLSGQTLVPLSAALVRVLGVAWLLTGLVLLGAAVLRALQSDLWWAVAAAGAVASQALIIFQWSDAKAGTAANLLVGAAIAMALVQRGR